MSNSVNTMKTSTLLRDYAEVDEFPMKRRCSHEHDDHPVCLSAGWLAIHSPRVPLSFHTSLSLRIYSHFSYSISSMQAYDHFLSFFSRRIKNDDHTSLIHDFFNPSRCCTPDWAQVTMTVSEPDVSTNLFLRFNHRHGVPKIGSITAPCTPSQIHAEMNHARRLNVMIAEQSYPTSGLDAAWGSHPVYTDSRTQDCQGWPAGQFVN